ncbi:hypothetical protein HP548_31015 [Paenibacillus taichungensis]|uniref:Copper amine oxidase-like N-terminal domain-containing protein n=1 Tax=Paenibacillus taichungensis TaxID=484184 RepID=A0ABX2MXA2_9BACL|nr:hypothetical protein [Paenibacillus taichungensis]NUU58517.1 hypothetical protein [Paenibacillus taichungensis]
MKKLMIVTLDLSLLSASMAYTAISAPKKISVVFNEKELKTPAGAEPKIIDGRVYIPANILRGVRFSVEYKNSTLHLVNSYFLYMRNLIEMHVFDHVFTTRFNKIDQEVVNILGKVILEESVDFSKLQQFIEEAESNVSISPDTFTPVLDYNSYDFSPVRESVEAYKKASLELIAYVNTGDKERLKSFYQERKKHLSTMIVIHMCMMLFLKRVLLVQSNRGTGVNSK